MPEAEKTYTKADIENAKKHREAAKDELEILKEQLKQKKKLTAEDKEQLQTLRDKRDANNQILEVENEQQKAAKSSQDLLKSTTSIGKKLTKELQKQKFSQKQSIGFGKLQINYGKKWVQDQKAGLGHITGIISKSETLSKLKAGENEQVDELVQDMDAVSQGLVDEVGYKMLAAKYSKLAAEATEAENFEVADMAKRMEMTAVAGGKFLKAQEQATKTSGFLADKWKKIVGFIGAGAIALGIWKTLKKAFLGASAITDELGASFGVAGAQAGPLKTNLKAARLEAIGVGGSLEDVTAITTTLSDSFGMNIDNAAALSDEIFDSAKAMGLSADEGGALFGTLMKMGNMTQAQAEDLAEGTYQLALANKVNPATVMKDIAENTDYFAQYGGKGAKNIGKAAIQARKLGISMDDVAGIAEGLLDFETSIGKEMTMSMVLGRRINLQKARMLAFDDDHAGMMQEIVKQVGGAAKWESMRGMEKKMFADMLGIEVGTMAKLALAEKERSGLALTGAEKEELRAANAMSAATDLMNTFKKMGATLLADLGEPLENLAKRFSTWMRTADEDGVSTLTRIENWIKKIGDRLGGWIKSFENFFKKGKEGESTFEVMQSKFKKLEGALERSGKIFMWVLDKTEKIGEKVALIAKSFGGWPKLLKTIGIALIGLKLTLQIMALSSPFGWVMLAITAIALLWTNWDKIWGLITSRFVGFGEWFKRMPGIIFHGFLDPFIDVFNLFGDLFSGDIGFGKFLKGLFGAWFDFVYRLPIILLNIIGSLFGAGELGSKIFDGIKWIAEKVFDGLTWPFRKAFWWIIESLGFGGKSASKLGLSILEGIKSIGTTLLNFLTKPFKEGWKLIKGIVSGDIGIADTIKGIGNIVLDHITWPFRTAMNFIGKLFGVKSLGDSIIQPIKDGFSIGVDGIKEKFTALKEWFSGFGEKIKNVFSNVGDFIGKIWDSLITILKAPFNLITKGINMMIAGINSLSIDIPEWLPFVDKDTSIGFNLPLIPELQSDKGKGWKVEKSGIAGVHEGEMVGTFDFQPIVAEIQMLKSQMAKPEFDLSSVNIAMADSTKETVATKEEIAKLRIEMGHYFGLGGSSSAKVTGKEVSRRIWGK